MSRPLTLPSAPSLRWSLCRFRRYPDRCRPVESTYCPKELVTCTSGALGPFVSAFRFIADPALSKTARASPFGWRVKLPARSERVTRRRDPGQTSNRILSFNRPSPKRRTESDESTSGLWRSPTPQDKPCLRCTFRCRSTRPTTTSTLTRISPEIHPRRHVCTICAPQLNIPRVMYGLDLVF